MSPTPAASGQRTPAAEEKGAAEPSVIGSNASSASTGGRRRSGMATPGASTGRATPSVGGQSTPGSGSEMSDDFRPVSHSTASWLEAFGVKEVVEEALLAPLRELVRERHEVDATIEMEDPELEMDYLESLSDKDPQWISMMLSRTMLLTDIARRVAKAANRFSQVRKRRAGGDGGGDDAFDRNRADSKFFDEDFGDSLVYGTPDVFFSGLDGFIGPPNPNLESSVKNEHCKQDDSGEPFVVPNYKTRTTSRIGLVDEH